MDWVTLVGPESLRDWAVDRLKVLLGTDPAKSAHARAYQSGFGWEEGAVVAFDQIGEAATCKVELTGSCLAELDPLLAVGFVIDCRAAGFHLTRLDLCVDFIAEAGASVGLLFEVAKGIQDGELCGFRRVKVDAGWAGRVSSGRTVTLGKKGKSGGGVQVCVYDKGVETGDRPAGEWERVEARFYAERAEQAFASVIDCSELRADGLGVSLSRLIYAACFGAVEFREFIEREGVAVRRSRRPIAAWWRRWVDGVQLIRTHAVRRLSSWKGLRRHVEHALRPVVSMAAAAGLDWREHLDRMLEGGVLAPRPGKRLSLGARQGLDLMRAAGLLEGGVACATRAA